MPKKNTVYKITSPSGKYYIGSTNNLERRFREHCGIENTKNHGSRYIRHAAAKYGVDNLCITILNTCGTREEAYAIEQELLDEYYNDELCMNHAESAYGHTSDSAKKARAKVKNLFNIHSYMEAHPEKRGGRKGKTYKSESAKQRGAKYIIVLDSQDKEVGRFEDIKSLQAAFPQFVSAGAISNCAHGKLKHYKKHKFIYSD